MENQTTRQLAPPPGFSIDTGSTAPTAAAAPPPTASAPTLKRPAPPPGFSIDTGAAQQTAPEAPKGRTLLRAAGDLGVGLAEGAVSAGMFIPQLANTLTGGAVDRYAFKPLTAAVDRLTGGPGEGRTLAEASQDTRSALDTLKSPQLQAQEQELADTKGFLPTAKALLTHPALLTQQVAEQVPQLIAPGGIVRKAGQVAFERAAGEALAKGVAKRVAAGMSEDAARVAATKAAERVGQRAALKAGAKAAVGSEAAISASQNSEQAQQEVMGLDQSVLDANPDYQAAIAAGSTPQQAREQLAQQAGLRAGAAGAAITAATGGLTAGLESRIFQGHTGVEGIGNLLTGEGLKKAAQATGKEFVQEGLQEGGEQLGQNIGVQSVDPNKSLTDQVPEQAALGGIVGGLTGGGTFAASAALSRPSLQRPKFEGAAPGSLSDAANTIEAAAPSGPLSRAAAAAPTTAPATATAAPIEAAASSAPQASAPVSAAAAPESQPSASRMAPGIPPWIDTSTGAVTPPSKAALTAQLAQHIIQQYDTNGHMRINTGELASAWGIPEPEVKRARNDATQIANRTIRGRDAMGGADQPTPTAEAGAAVEAPSSEAGTVASVPVMITQGMKRELRTLGHTDGDIAKMTPQQAHDVLRAGEPLLKSSREISGEQGGAAVDQAVAEQQKPTTDTAAEAMPQGESDATVRAGSAEDATPAGTGATTAGPADAQPAADAAAGPGRGDAAQPQSSDGATVPGAGAVAEPARALTEPVSKADELPAAAPLETTEPPAKNNRGDNPTTETPPTGGVPASGAPVKISGAARDAEGLRVKTADGETNGRTQIDQLVEQGFTKVESTRAGDKMVHSLVNSEGKREPIKARQLKYAKEATAKAAPAMPAVKESLTAGQKRSGELLGAGVGDTVRTTGDGADIQAGSIWKVERIDPNGTVHISSPGGGSGAFTRAELEREVRKGATFEKAKPVAAAPAREAKAAPKLETKPEPTSAPRAPAGATELDRREVPQYNPMRPAEGITRTLYRETDAEGASELLDGMRRHAGPGLNTVYAASDEHLALGQGNNRGIAVELNPAAFDARLNLDKPISRQMITSTGAAELEIVPKAKTDEPQVLTVTLKPGWKKGQNAGFSNRVLLRLRQLQAKGWTKNQTEAGIEFRAPALAAAPEQARDSAITENAAAAQSAQHLESGAEPVAATPAEVAKSAATAAQTIDMASARKELLRQVDEAIQTAPSEDRDGAITLHPPRRESGNQVRYIGMDRTLPNGLPVPDLKIVEGKKSFSVFHGRDQLTTEPSLASAKFYAERALRAADWTEKFSKDGGWDFSGIQPDNYVLLDVPGDGKFKVRNTIERLQAFRKEVEAKFKAPSSRAPKVEGPNTTESRSLSMADAKRQEILSQAEQVDAAAAEAATSPTNDKPEPTQAQKEAGNYAKGHVSLHGLDISIENPRGSERTGVDPNGKAWAHTMSDHYGYVRRTTGADGEQVDVYIGPNPDSDQVFVVDQMDQGTGKFDEHKAMVGFDSEADAVKAYRSNFDKGWNVGPVHAMSVDEFKGWLKDGDTSLPAGEHVATDKSPDAQEFEHNGTRIYPVDVRDAGGKVIQRWAVESATNKFRHTIGERPIGGDSLASTADEARKIADLEKKQAEQRAARDAEQSAAKEKEDEAAKTRRERVQGKSLAEIRAMDRLDEKVKADGKVVTRRQWMERLIGSGATPSTEQVDKIKPMSRQQFNRASNEEQRAHEKRVKEGGKVTNYYVGDFKVGKIEYDFAQSLRADNQAPVSAEEGQLRNFGWDAVKLSEYSYDELNTLRAQVEQQHANPKDAQGHPLSNGQPSIHLYDREGRRKLDALAWAVTYKLQESRAERERIAAEIAAGEPPPKVPEQVQRSPEPASLPAQRSEPAKPAQMTMAEWKATHKDFKGMIDGKRTVLRDGRVVPVEIVKASDSATADTKAATSPTASPARSELDQATTVLDNARSGSGSLDELRAAFARVRDNKEAVKAELSKLTKPELAKRYGLRDDTKARMVTDAYRSVLSGFTLRKSISYVMTGNANEAYLSAVQRLVDGLEQKDLDSYAKEFSDLQQRREEIKAAQDNPKTIEDFQRLAYSKGGESKLSPEQRAEFDRLRADARREKREEEAKRAAVVSKVDTGGTGMQLMETKHTQKGHDLFVVKMEERVEPDVYQALNQAAKRLGGYYSSYRGNGAVPGFTFTSRDAAEQFMAVRNGNVDASAQQQDRDSAKDEQRAETLAQKAEKLRIRGEERLNADRKDNTARRARMAEHAEREARAEIATAGTMARIAAAIEDGSARMLKFINARTQVSLLERTLSQAHWHHLRDQGVQWEKAKEMAPTAASVATVTLPQFWLTRGDAAVVAKRLAAVRGGKTFGDSIAKEIDYGDEYGAAVKANPHKFVLTKKRADGEGGSDFAFFSTKRDAEAAIRATQGAAQKQGLVSTPYVVVKLPGAGKTSRSSQDWAVAMSPEQAIERKLWAPDFDKKVHFSAAGAGRIMDLLKVGDRGDQQVPYWWASHAADRAAFARIGIETNYELREALREYLPLRQDPAGEDRVRKLERALVGDKGVGVDFFPTPPAVVERLVEQADIGPGMRVLEPSAGKGDIAEALRDAADGVTVDTVEMSHALREILDAKGFESQGADFLAVPAEPVYDRVVMNPPFGSDNGAAHVRHAYDMLKPGGRLVAVMGAGSRGKAQFDEWLDQVGGLSEPLPEGSFKSSFRPTGVATQVVVIDKGTAAEQAARRDFSFAGERAATADRSALEQAKQMEAMGRDSVPDRYGNQPGSPEDTHVATGWHRGVDGKWRFEIDDSSARVISTALKDRATKYAMVKDLVERRQAALDAGDQAAADKLSGRIEAAQAAFNAMKTLRMDQVLEHPALYAAYPDLAAVRVRVEPAMKSWGSYSPTTGDISIRSPAAYPATGTRSLKSVLLHEIQHAIQQHEGFARGGSAAEARTLPEFEQLLKQYMAEHEDRLPSWTEVVPGPEQLEQTAAHKVYLRLAGEVEARNTQRRAAMTAEERRAIPASETADVPRADQIVRFNGGNALDEGSPRVTADQQAQATRVQAIVDRLQQQWQGSDVPRVQVVATPEQLPGSAKVDERGRPDSSYQRANGFYDGRTIYIVASRHAADEGKIATTLAHEAIGHYGVDRIVDRELGAGAWDKIQSAADRLRANPGKASQSIRDVLADVERRYPGADSNTFAREFLAVSAERGVRNGLLDRVVTALRRWVRKLFPNMKLKLSEAEFRQLLVHSKDYLEQGPTYAQKVQARSAMAFSRDGWDPAFPDAVVAQPHGFARAHADYAAGKAGDRAAALRLARDAVTPEFVQRVRDALPADSKPIVVPVHATEATGDNEIPRMAAEVLAAKLGAEADTDIVQAAKVSRGGSDAMHRLANQPTFAGKVQVGRDYVLLDDTLAQGGTLAQLKTHIERGGGRVVLATALTAKDYSRKLALDPDMLRKVRGRYGSIEGWWKQQFGYGFDGLTESEARAILTYDKGRLSPDGLRNRVAAGKIEGIGSMGTPAIGDRPGTEAPGTSGRVTDMPAFKRWFGASKVVDAEGKPLVVYHGTTADFESFSHEFMGEGNGLSDLGDGFYFTDMPEVASNYAQGDGGQVMPVYLAMKNPATNKVLAQSDVQDAMDDGMGFTSVQEVLEGLGFDGIIYTHKDGAKEYVVFRPEQVKSAIGNRGTFDVSQPRTDFSLDANADPDETARRNQQFADASASIEAISAELPQIDRGTYQAAKDWIAGKARDFEPRALGALQLRHVLELAAESKILAKPAKLYADLYQRMDGDRNTLTQEGAEKVDSLTAWAREKGAAGWAGKLKPEAQALFKFMHAVTQLAIDPTSQYERLLMRDSRGEQTPWTRELIKERIKELRGQIRGRPGDDKTPMMEEINSLRKLPARERTRALKYPELVAAWNALTPAAKEHFAVMRDHYKAQSEALEQATIEHIEALDIPAQNKRAAADLVRRNFEDAKVGGVYFPLMRFGDYWISAHDKDGEYLFAKYETAGQQADAERRLKASGATIESTGRQDNNYRSKDAPSGTFMGDLMGVLRAGKAPESVQDQIYQMYLKTLPELSLRKRGIHRKNVAGYTDNVPRAFAASVFHGAHQLAKARYGWQLQNTLENMRETVEGNRPTMSASVAAHSDALIGEINRRHDWILNPTNNKLATAITSIGFTYFLGASPASALVNLIQVPQIVLPVLGAQHGWGSATRVLTRTMKDAFRTGGNIEKVLRGEDLQAFKALQQQGTFQRTATHSLAGLAEGDNLRSNPAYTRVLNAVSWLFHKSEVINREGTGMAAFRLAREKGMSFDAAVKYADEITNGTHGDYSNANRARYMQGNTAKVLFQFKNYSLSMSWLWGRQFYKAFKGESPEVKAAARRTLTGLLGMTGLFAGVVGMPIFNLLRYAAQAVHFATGDDDEPWDFMTEFRSWLAEHLGETAAAVIADGPASQLGANISSRVSMSDLWFRDADRQLQGEDAYNNLLQSMAGPTGGLVRNLYVGAQQFNEGHTERGIETMLPTFAKNALKAVRFAHEGVNTLRGDPIVPDVGTPSALVQALGFQPTKIAEQQRVNNALYTYQQFIQERRQGLMNAFAMALQSGDAEGRGDVLQRIQAFNAKYPEIAIRPSNLRASLRTRAQRSAQSENGIMLNKKIGDRVRQEVGAIAGG